MPQPTPPLAWLRAFEAAGRLSSFRAAADELNVTPSAVSHHIRSLEQRLEQPLFERTPNRVKLTREGSAYLKQLSVAFRQLASAAEVLAPSGHTSRLTIGAFPFLVSEVLMPHLDALRQALPGTEIRLVSDTSINMLSHEDPSKRVDAIVRYGNGRFPACHAQKLTRVELVTIVAPHSPWAGLKGTDVLKSHPRVSVAGPFDGWGLWAQRTGVTLSNDSLAFDSYVAAMRAVEQGLGIGLGVRPFIDGWLQSGRITLLDEEAVDAEQGSYLVTPAFRAPNQALDALKSWLLERFASSHPG